jgi:hypothetical protein
MHPWEHLWSIGQERFERLVGLALVARVARDHQIGDAIAASATLGDHVVNFQRDACGLTVSALMLLAVPP